MSASFVGEGLDPPAKRRLPGLRPQARKRATGRSPALSESLELSPQVTEVGKSVSHTRHGLRRATLSQERA